MDVHPPKYGIIGFDPWTFFKAAMLLVWRIIDSLRSTNSVCRAIRFDRNMTWRLSALRFWKCQNPGKRISLSDPQFRVYYRSVSIAEVHRSAPDLAWILWWFRTILNRNPTWSNSENTSTCEKKQTSSWDLQTTMKVAFLVKSLKNRLFFRGAKRKGIAGWRDLHGVKPTSTEEFMGFEQQTWWSCVVNMENDGIFDKICTTNSILCTYIYIYTWAYMCVYVCICVYMCV